MPELVDELCKQNVFQKKQVDLLYRMARLARNTDGLHPSTAGPKMGQLLLELRLMDGERYLKEVM